MVARVMLPALGTVVLAGAYVVHEGAVRIAVDEQAPGGTHIHLLLPAALVPVGMKFVPDQKLREATAQARPWLPAIRAASQELARLPDSDLVEVRDAEQHVSISKRGALLVIDVQSTRESVHVSVPLHTVEEVAREVESWGRRSRRDPLRQANPDFRGSPVLNESLRTKPKDPQEEV